MIKHLNKRDIVITKHVTQSFDNVTSKWKIQDTDDDDDDEDTDDKK